MSKPLHRERKHQRVMLLVQDKKHATAQAEREPKAYLT